MLCYLISSVNIQRQKAKVKFFCIHQVVCQSRVKKNIFYFLSRGCFQKWQYLEIEIILEYLALYTKPLRGFHLQSLLPFRLLLPHHANLKSFFQRFGESHLVAFQHVVGDEGSQLH